MVKFSAYLNRLVFLMYAIIEPLHESMYLMTRIPTCQISFRCRSKDTLQIQLTRSARNLEKKLVYKNLERAWSKCKLMPLRVKMAQSIHNLADKRFC